MNKFQSNKKAKHPRIINAEACKDNNGDEAKNGKKKENTYLNRKSV